jgi:hypothetical protein
MVLAKRYRKNHAKPFGPDLKVKPMFDGRASRAKKFIIVNIV